MFGNKKNNLPPRPHPPTAEQILEDISNTDNDDAVFKFVDKSESRGEGLHYPTNSNDAEVVYEKIQSYLKTKERLKEFGETLARENESLRSSDTDMRKLADDIKRQAQEALVNRQ